MMFRRKAAIAPGQGVMNFRTDLPDFAINARGVGIHQGRVPEVLDGIEVDGLPIQFNCPATLVKIHETMVKVVQARRRHAIIDCYGFLALYSGIPEAAVPERTDKYLRMIYNPESIDESDIKDGDVLAIASRYHDIESPIYRHGLVAADSAEGLKAFHVLGTEGPLALSGILEAERTFGAYSVHRLDYIELAA